MASWKTFGTTGSPAPPRPRLAPLAPEPGGEVAQPLAIAALLRVILVYPDVPIIDIQRCQEVSKLYPNILRHSCFLADNQATVEVLKKVGEYLQVPSGKLT